jgi:bifunctional UDP-N-acetylglucosamine pyrophosphorylase/glucosamine-1-phosphate N-acetyltransferase
MSVPEKTRPSLAAVLLAAGKGKRLKSHLPKVLYPVCGRPALWHVAHAALGARPERIVVVVGEDGDAVEEAVRSWSIEPPPAFVRQRDPLGTGHAVAAAEGVVRTVSEVLVMGGDDPLVERAHVRALLAVHRRTRAAASILTTDVDEPGGYGRVLRDGNRFLGIVEETELSREQRSIREMSTLVYAFRREELYAALPLVGRDNRQREFYLPDVLGILLDKGERVSAVKGDFDGWAGVNSRATLARLNSMMRARINERHLAGGVTIVDPSTTSIDVEVRIGPDTVVEPFTFLRGSTRIGSGCVIGPGSEVVDSVVGDGAAVRFSVVRGSRLGPGVDVGPYTHLRPGTVLRKGAKAGAFVEIKASQIGTGAKVPHLSYVGDAVIGDRANVGAGTVTVNYDGYRKHRTSIGPDARIGSDTMLVAPVRVGSGAVTGAGSVITKDVAPGALAVERSEQRIVKGYRKRKDAEASKGKPAAPAKAKGKGKR